MRANLYHQRNGANPSKVIYIILAQFQKVFSIRSIWQNFKGNFWSSGKGSIKFNYLPNSNLVIVIKDGLISVKEMKDGPISQYSIKDSPISSLFSDNFKLENFIINKIMIEGSIGTIELRAKKILHETQYFSQVITLIQN